jgi:glycine/D-amino acid oxidase-like deaminating enzyme
MVLVAQTARPLRVLVIGAGVSGISVARGLLRDGHDVTISAKTHAPAAAP